MSAWKGDCIGELRRISDSSVGIGEVDENYEEDMEDLDFSDGVIYDFEPVKRICRDFTRGMDISK